MTEKPSDHISEKKPDDQKDQTSEGNKKETKSLLDMLLSIIPPKYHTMVVWIVIFPCIILLAIWGNFIPESYKETIIIS